MDKAWAVSSGSYSDYTVHCVCDSKERAEQVRDILKADDNGFHSDAEVEEFPYVNSEPEQVTILHLSCVVWDDGTTTDGTRREVTTWPFATYHDVEAMAWDWCRAPVYKDRGGRLDVSGTDHERVQRVFSDRRAMLLADDPLRMQPRAKGAR